ncbi:MAG: hypothetical protein QME96_04930 [Myxococcota bacterium]|nr:hypothetical protein [Myxococcota bacterium]MDI7267319.1 hypothetical protein [Myxococcota bacterium]
MMRGLEFQVEWREPSPDDDAFGPETRTWAALAIRLDGALVSLNHPADWKSDADREFVVGGMSGLAEWLVENWTYLLWETHPPFPRAPVHPGSAVPRIPSLRDAHGGWRDLDPDIPRVDVARWQHRHSFGHGSSPLAVPSIVFLPDERAVGVLVDHLPSQIDPTVRFSPGPDRDAWPADPVWVRREDLGLSLSEFVSSVLDRAKRHKDARGWAVWLDKAWQAERVRADDKEHRRKLMFGDVVASRWSDLEKELGERLAALEGLLADSLPPAADSEIDFLRGLAVEQRACAPAVPEPLDLDGLERSLPPFIQGYRLAVRLRDALGLHEDPVVDLPGLLHDRFGVSVQPIGSKGMFRAAVVASSSGGCLWYANDDPRFSGVPPVRFAVAAALGRWVSEVTSSARFFGAAHGPQARVRETQRANAFAAEFLLPGRVAGVCRDIEAVAAEYGISRSAAEWQRANHLAKG